MRLLEEEAEAIRSRAADKTMAAREELTAEDWEARDRAPVGGSGCAPPDEFAAAGAELEAEAAELEGEAQEIAQHLAETRDAA